MNFVPDARPVFREVARVLREGGFYRLSCWNPSVHGITESDWDGCAYPLRLPYVEGAESELEDGYWDVDPGDGIHKRVRAPREFRHTLGTLVNGLVEQGFVILGVWEDTGDDPHAEPGTWKHFKSIAAPWLGFWASYRPYAFPRSAEQERGA